jgi:hypothetical protein
MVPLFLRYYVFKFGTKSWQGFRVSGHRMCFRIREGIVAILDWSTKYNFAYSIGFNVTVLQVALYVQSSVAKPIALQETFINFIFLLPRIVTDFLLNNQPDAQIIQIVLL